jgi:hypothetical protein
MTHTSGIARFACKPGLMPPFVCAVTARAIARHSIKHTPPYTPAPHALVNASHVRANVVDGVLLQRTALGMAA